MHSKNPKYSLAKNSLLIALLWVVFNIICVGFAWSKSYFVDFGPRPTVYAIDLRQNKTANGHIITFVATQAQPSKYWYFGHMWVVFDTTPESAKKGEYQFGYYSKNQTQAAKELLISYLNPFGFYFGQKTVEGIIKSDDPWTHHLELVTKIDDAAYAKALETDKLWRVKKEYTNHPAWGQTLFWLPRLCICNCTFDWT